MRNRIKVLFGVVVASVAFQVFGKPSDSILDHLDSDGDGMISILEFKPLRGGRMIKGMDGNNDGVVTTEEMSHKLAELQWKISRRQTKIIERLRTLFNESDSDGNGNVTYEEAQAAAFSRLDENSDGYLSFEELDSDKFQHSVRRRGKLVGGREGSFGRF